MHSLIKKILIIPFALLYGWLLGSCGHDEEPEPPAPQGDAVRSVLVYMVANNSLGGSANNGYDALDLKEMDNAAKAGSLGANRLLVYHHAYRAEPELIEITSSGRKVLKHYDTSHSSVSAARMEEVIADFKEIAPAQRYGIVLWSHASGWLENGLDEELGIVNGKLRAFGVDGNTSRQMNVTTLAAVLEGKGFDFVYFDCCHMAGVEVAYQLRRSTPVVVGSSSELPADGMPYDATLPYLMADDADLVGAAKQTFMFYDAQQGVYRTCTISVIDTSKLDALADAVGDFYAMHPTLPDGYQGQKFIAVGCRYFDLAHYLHGLADGSIASVADADLVAAYDRAISAIEDAVVYKNATPYLWYGQLDQVKIDSHCGLSTYIMRTASDADAKRLGYERLDWWKNVASRLWR